MLLSVSIFFTFAVIELGCLNRTDLVKWRGFRHNSLIFNYKVTKIWPLDQIFIPLILLKSREMNAKINFPHSDFPHYKITGFSEAQDFFK